MGRENLNGKLALVTGASSGIGYATAILLAECGVRLAIASRNTQALEELAKVIRKLGQEALVATVDVTQQAQVEAAIHKTLLQWGRIDILIANSGQYIRSPIAEVTLPLIEKSIAVNFYGGVYAVLAVLPHMLANHRGHIVLMTTMNAKKGIPLDAPYVAAKSALSGFGEVLRQELHGTGVHVTTVFPGRGYTDD
jgi:NADP-dependent 3-hydroxy acid dehydrogenase YdfG